MHLMRFLDKSGAKAWGKPDGERQAIPLVGDVFGDYRFAQRPVQVQRRLAPIEPPNILAIGRNYREHAKEMRAENVPAEPLVFLKATTSVIGPEDAVVLPASAPDEVDYEAELAIIIGKTARGVSEELALDYVCAFTCANDITARDCQKRRDQQWARAKSFDTFCPLGPVMVTPDQFDAGAATVRLILNGTIMQEGKTEDMIFPPAALISYLSHQFTLLPGTLILTGTPAGVGAARQPPVFLRAGDEVSVEIEGIGRLTNRVISSGSPKA